MPQEPKKKHSKAVKRTRRAAKSLKALALVICKNCGANTPAHIVCRFCGFYAGKLSTNAKTAVTVTKA